MSHRSKWAGMLAAATLVCGGAPAWAACTMTSVALPVTMDGLTPMVTVKVNGKDARFMLDSGSYRNGISAQFAVERKMKAATVEETGWRLPARAEERFEGVGGRPTVAAFVLADQFVFAGSTFKDVRFATFDRLTGLDGLIGLNFLNRFDQEYDFGHGVLKIMGPKGCDRADLAYWVKPGTAYSVMPMDRDLDDPRAKGAIWINGVKLWALFDTGSDTTFITERAAARAGVKVTDPGVVEAGYTGGLDTDRIKTWTARFASIKIGDEEIKNGLLEIGQTSADDFDVLVGADFFLSHHVLASNSQGKIYFTYEGGQVFNVSSKTGAASAEGIKDGGSK